MSTLLVNLTVTLLYLVKTCPVVSLSINDEEANFPSASVIDDAGVANEATIADSSNSSASKCITVAEISPLPKNIRSSSKEDGHLPKLLFLQVRHIKKE